MAKKAGGLIAQAQAAVAEEWPDEEAAADAAAIEGEVEELDPEEGEGEGEKAPAPEPAEKPVEEGEKPEPLELEVPADAKAPKPELPKAEAEGEEKLPADGRFPWGELRTQRKLAKQYEQLQTLFRTDPAAAMAQISGGQVVQPQRQYQQPVQQQPQVPQQGQPQFHPALGQGVPLIDPRTIPTLEEDPLQHLAGRLAFQEQQTAIALWGRDQQSLQQQNFQQENQFQQAIRQSEAEFKATGVGDYDEATEWLAESEREEGKLQGVPDAINPQTGENYLDEYVRFRALQAARMAYQTGNSFAQVVYGVAKMRGWNGGPPGAIEGKPLSTPAAQKAASQKVADSKARSKVTRGSMSATPEAKPVVIKKPIESAADIMNLTDEQLQAMDAKYGEGWEDRFLEEE